MTISDIPALNATLNGIATVLILTGFALIKSGKKDAHRKVMLAAGVVSAVFLVGYVSHKALVRGVHTPFGGEGMIRTVYYVMLFTHIVLAIAIAYLVPRTFLLAIKGEYERHKAWAKWTFPIWLYVSVTGVLVYFFLYRWWPAH
jgi:putative membrane protein